MRVTEHRAPPNARSRAPFKVLVEDDTGDVELVFFLANHEWMRARLPVGATRWVSGKLELWDGHRQMVHPDRVMDADEFARLPAVEPVYGADRGPLPADRRARGRGRAEAAAAPAGMDRATTTLERLKLPGFAEALAAMHRPAAPGRHRSRPGRPATRLAYDELLANQLALLLVRARMRALAGRAHARATGRSPRGSRRRCRSR